MDKQSTPLEPFGSEEEGITNLHISNYLPVNKVLVTQKALTQHSISVECAPDIHHKGPKCQPADHTLLRCDSVYFGKNA
jgi:hypothetical protein